ncbi:MAG: helix-turn-helix transcriptional regulator [Oscillospiraceae bacterium]|nr:helix-turn-helix transcriptional regulator [Oscillospiraceae bacterium]MBR6658101.1 helix-turn-helix transcriptional regulator [Oscillospiraceae bacterium]
MTIGEKIYKLRTERNLSQGELSEMLEVSRQSISKWENGAATPDLDKIIKLSEIFGITIDELVKSNEVSASAEEKPQTIIIKKESNFPPRKIIGTILLSLSLIVTVVLLAAGGGILGLVLSSPLILCGIICFAFKKNIGLWCAWAVFFTIDMYLRMATGISSAVVLNFQTLLFMIRGGDFVRLLLAFAQLAVIVSLVFITIFRFRKIPLESKKMPIIFWSLYGVLKIALAVFSLSHLYKQIINYVFSTMNTGFYTFFHSFYVWIYTGFFVAAVVFTVRYIVTKKSK